MSDPRFTCHFLDDAAKSAAESARMTLARSRPEGNQFASLYEVVRPCAMWSCPWLFDPNDPEEQSQRTRALEEIANGTFVVAGWYLSKHYWTDWSDKRAPIEVLCPNGRGWCVDSKSSNGTGWVVTGDAPAITASPSIVVPGYHGFLRGGVFTPDLDGGRGDGIGIIR